MRSTIHSPPTSVAGHSENLMSSNPFSVGRSHERGAPAGPPAGHTISANGAAPEVVPLA